MTYTYSNNQIQARSTGSETATATFVLTNGKITKATYTGKAPHILLLYLRQPKPTH